MNLIATTRRVSFFAAVMLAWAGVTTAAEQYSGHPVLRPSGKGPHPAVILVSGCYGFNAEGTMNQDDRNALDFNVRGFLVAMVDYLADLHVSSCERITPSQAMPFVVAAATWIRAQLDVDPENVTAVGWSFGGGAVLAALSAYPEARLGFTRVIAFYPDCLLVKPWPVRMPMLILEGELDQLVSNRLCEMRVNRSEGKGDVTISTFPDAQHAFDFTAIPYYPPLRRGYNSAASVAAWKQVWAFLGAAN